jgi:conjugal transfer pilus assembly protein TraL
MKDLSAFYIPKTLDEPEKLLFFTYQEISMLMFPTIVGISMDHVLTGMLAGALIFFIYRKINPASKGYSVTHLVYWYFPDWCIKLNFLPPSCIRLFI